MDGGVAGLMPGGWGRVGGGGWRRVVVGRVWQGGWVGDGFGLLNCVLSVPVLASPPLGTGFTRYGFTRG